MAGKITDLTALASGHATGDLMEILDISDTTMSANGTNKKTTLAQLFGNIPAPALLSNGTKAAPAIAFTSETGFGFYRSSGNVMTVAYSNLDVITISNGFGGLRLYTTWGLSWGTGESTSTADTGLHRNAAGVVEINNGTTGTFRDLRLRNEIRSGLSATSAAAPTIASAGTIAPTVGITFISGVAAIATITAPSPISTGGGTITLIPTGVFTWTAAGNIALAGTAVVGKALTMTYDTTTTKWYPSYTA